MSVRPAALISHPYGKPALAALLLLPFVYLVFCVTMDRLGPNPAEALIRSSGDWTLRMLCLTLAVTPARVLSGWHALARYRRMVGLFTAFYALIHALSYLMFDMEFVWAAVGADLVKRPFIAVGMLAFTLLAVLAGTSTTAAVRLLGAMRWQRLHRAVYGIAGLALLHFFWMRSGKQDFAEVAVYGLVLGTLLGWRAVRFKRK